MTNLQRFTLICLLFSATLLFFSNVVFAFDVPKDAIIKVFSKDGKQIGDMDRSAYKVVKIEDKKSTLEAKPKEIRVTKTITRKIYLKRSVKRRTIMIQNEYNTHEGRYDAGLSYEHQSEGPLKWEIKGMTSGDFSGGIGYSY